jgi:hypothetical protein
MPVLPRSQTGDFSAVYVQSVFWRFFRRKHSFAEKEKIINVSLRKYIQFLQKTGVFLFRNGYTPERYTVIHRKI